LPFVDAIDSVDAVDSVDIRGGAWGHRERWPLAGE